MNNHSAAEGLRRRALSRLRTNVRSGYDPYYRRQFFYVRPSPGRYSWQWFWDSGFHAIALARLDAEMARKELLTLVASQREDGFIGHMVYWGRLGAIRSLGFAQGPVSEWRRRHTGMIQPPMLAQAVEAVHKASEDGRFLNEILPATTAYYDWIARERDAAGDGLVSIISPFECGLDNSPAFDSNLGLRNPSRMSVLWALRRLDLFNLRKGFDFGRIAQADRFVVIDPFVNTVYADGLHTLARLHDDAGNAAESARATATAQAVESSLNSHCWDEENGRFLFLHGRERRPGDILTAASLFPAILPGTPPDRTSRVIDEHLTNPAEFWTELPVPSVSASEPSFDAEGESMIWRGPVCMNLNWFLVRGLRGRGYDELAGALASRSVRAVEANGFREFYSPASGRGMRGTNFGWATAVVDFLDADGTEKAKD